MITSLYPQHDAPLDDGELLEAYAYRDSTQVCARFNFVSAADGGASHEGVSGRLGGAADKRVFSLLRRLCDAVVVGAGTVRAEGYAGELVDEQSQQWRLDHGMSAHPALVIISGSLDLEPDAQIFTLSPVRPILLTTDHAPAARREQLAGVAHVAVAGSEELDVEAALNVLSGRGLTRLLCEGGPGVFGSFQTADRVDELCLTLSPTLTGGTGPRIAKGPEHALQNLRLDHILREGSELLLRYSRTD